MNDANGKVSMWLTHDDIFRRGSTKSNKKCSNQLMINVNWSELLELLSIRPFQPGKVSLNSILFGLPRFAENGFIRSPVH